MNADVPAANSDPAQPEPIVYGFEPELRVEEFADVLLRSTLAERRPMHEMHTLERMLRNASIIATARQSGTLMGIARSITDFAYCTYLSDLAVDADLQQRGIGRELIRLTHEKAGRHTTLILLAAPKAESYYPQLGMEQHPSCWFVRRLESPPEAIV